MTSFPTNQIGRWPPPPEPQLHIGPPHPTFGIPSFRVYGINVNILQESHPDVQAYLREPNEPNDTIQSNRVITVESSTNGNR